MQVEDNKILADLVGTLVATDKYNRSFGDLAVQADKTSKYVGQPNADASEWKYKISSAAKWFNYQGTFQRQIKASDMINTAKFVLFPKTYQQPLGFDELLLLEHKKFESIFKLVNINRIIIITQFEQN